ncbi:hypothetical protein AMECASPLE_032836 [Ameca splendens]|uniref:Uncharacterized protein n=1 Tax=Ameca splendens TaxID=208324 RepID=A0ABV0XVI6_9TELE
MIKRLGVQQELSDCQEQAGSSETQRTQPPTTSLEPLSSSLRLDRLMYSRRISSNPGALPPRSFLITLVTLAPEIGEPAPRSPGSASSVEDLPVGLRRSSKYSPHRLTMS